MRWKREACSAWGKKCNRCGKKNQFAKTYGFNSGSKQVTMVEGEEEDYPVFQVFKVSASQTSDLNLVTHKVKSGNFIRFQIDTRARCNVLPVHIYKGTTSDFRHKKVCLVKSSIMSYDDGSIPVLGTMKIQVQRGSFTILLLCCLVKGKCCPPILGKTACERMDVVEIKDSDASTCTPVEVKFSLSSMQFPALKFSLNSRSLRCFLTFLMVVLKVNITSASTNPERRCSTLPEEVKSPFAIKLKKLSMNYKDRESSCPSRNLHSGSPRC